MKASLQLFNKGFIAEYFRQNVFFILIVLLLAFGFLSGAEHRQLVISAGKSKMFLFYIFGVWVVYFLFNILFAFRTLAKKEFYIFYNTNQLPNIKPIIIWTYAYFMCSPLSIYYGIHMIFRGLHEGFVFMPFAVLIFHLVFTVLGGFILYFRTLIAQESSFKFNFQLSIFGFFRKPFPFFYIAELIKNRPIMYILVKFFTFLIISFFIYLYPTDEYDYRLFSIALVIVVFSNYPLMQEWLIYENQKSNFVKALPISALKHIIYMLVTIIILVVPEIILFGLKSTQFTDLAYIFSWAISLIFILLGLKSIFYLPLKIEKLQQNLFWVFIILLILIMYKVPLIVLAMPISILSAWSIYRFYGNWEPGKELFFRE
jgi:hypothetical protein